MPAVTSGPTDTAPLTYRPLGARVAAVVGGACLTAVLLVMWFAFPASIRADFTVLEVVTLLLFLLGALAVLHGIARTRVTSDAEGLAVLNCYRRRHVAWEEVVDISLSTGMPWALVRTVDGGRVSLIAVQGSDGERARAQVRLLRHRLAESRSGHSDHP